MARWLGIDITKTAVRVALIRSRYRRTSLEALREVRRSDYATTEQAIAKATAGLRSDSIATCLSGERVFLRHVSLPKAAQKELESVLGYEVESTLPFEMDDGIMDHRLLTPLPDMDEAHQLPILAGVAYVEELRERIDVVRRGTGHEPARIGVGSLPYVNLEQLAPEFKAADVSAIVDVDDYTIDVLILRKGEPRFVRSLSCGTAGMPANAELVARELRQTLGAWRAQGGHAISSVHLVGSGVSIHGMADFLQSRVGITVRDLPKLALDGATPEQHTRLPRFAKAVSLALSLARRSADLNLRQGPLEAQQGYVFLREKLPMLAGLAAAIFVSFGFSVFAELQALEAEKETLSTQLERATEVRLGSKTRDVELTQRMLDDAIKGKSDDPLPEMDAFDFMVELARAVPEEVTHDIADFEVSREHVVFKGVVDTIDHAETVKDRLSSHACLKEVKIARTSRLEKQNKQKYTLELKIDCGTGAGKTPKGGK